MSAARILVVDDDERIRRLLSYYLVREGFHVRQAADGEQMRSRLSVEKTDLIILDLMLPGVDGLTLASELRAKSNVGIIILTGKTENADKVVGLELGADDYVTKPFDKRELLARVRTVLRRTGRSLHDDPAPGKSTARFDGWTLDLIAHELSSPAGENVELTSSEFRLLAGLAVRSNRVLTRQDALDLVSGRDWSPLDRSIDVMIGKLRKKIEPDPKSPIYIQTVRGVGYKFTARVELEKENPSAGYVPS